MTTVLELTKEVKPGYWSLRDRIEILKAHSDDTVPDVVVSILDDMYAVVGKDDLRPYMTIYLQTPVGYGLGLRMCELIEKIPQSDPRRADQALKLIDCVQSPIYDPYLFPIDRESIEAINRAISLLDPTDPRRTDEALAHIERIVNDPNTDRARQNSVYFGNHGYLYHAHRAKGVAEAIKLLPEGSDIQVGEAIQHLKYLMSEGTAYTSDAGCEFGIAAMELRELVASMLDKIPDDQHECVIEMATESRLGEVIEEYEGGKKPAPRTAVELAGILSILPKGLLDGENSPILITSTAFAQAAQQRYPIMLMPNEHGEMRREGWQLANLWQQVAILSQQGNITTDHISADENHVTFYPQGCTFNFGRN